MPEIAEDERASSHAVALRLLEGPQAGTVHFEQVIEGVPRDAAPPLHQFGMQALLISRVKAAEQAGQAVREAGMPPFRAVHVSRQLPGSHVDDRDAVFRRGQSRRQRRDGMAVDQHRGRGFSLYQQTGPAHDVGQQARIGKGCRGGAQPVAGADGVVLQQGGQRA